MGVFLAFIALISWGVGDFLIQRSARKFGDTISLFYICAFGAIVVFPFALNDLRTVEISGLDALLLGISCLVLLIASVAEFESLRRGKISVVEPVFAMELPITVLLAAVIIREFPSGRELFLMLGVIIGIILVSVRSFRDLFHIRWEHGIFLASAATSAMAFVNFLFGITSRSTSPLVINWITDIFFVVLLIIFLSVKGRWGEVRNDFIRHKELVISVSSFDNIAWIAYSFSMTLIPIPIATGISESYIALSAALGMIINREKLQNHQLVGLAMAVVAAVALGFAAG